MIRFRFAFGLLATSAVVAAHAVHAQNDEEILSLHCEGLQSVYTYNLGSGAVVFDAELQVALTIDLARGSYAYIDDAGAPGIARQFLSISNDKIVLRNEELGGEGFERNEHSAEIDRTELSYSFSSDVRHEDGTEDIRIGRGACREIDPGPVG